MNPTFANVITPQEMTLALQHILFAPAGTPWTIGRISVDSPPAGFLHAGAVMDDSPTFQTAKQFYDYSAGIPATLQYRAVTGITGSIGTTLNTFHPFAAYLALGGIAPWLAPRTAAQPWYAITSTTIARDTVSVTSTSGINVNDLVVTDTTAAINRSFNYAWVDSIVSATQLHLSNTGFPNVPVNNNPIFVVDYQRMALGTSISPFLHVLGVADAIDGMQIVHDLPRVQPSGQFQQALRNGQHINVPIQLDCFGYTVSSPHSSAGQLVVGEILIFSPTTTA